MSVLKNQSDKNKLTLLLPLCIFLLYDFIQLNMMSSFSPFFLKTIPMSPSQLGFVSSLFFYVNLALLIPAGFLLDSYQPKWLMSISIMFNIIGLLIFSSLHTISSMMLWRSFAGISGAFSYLSCVKILACHFSRKHLGLLLGLTGIIIMMAGIISQYPLVWVLNTFGLNDALCANAFFGLFTITLIISFNENIKLNKKTKLFKFNDVFLKKQNWLIAIYASLTNFPLFVLGALWGNLYLQHKHHLTLEVASFITSMLFIGNMIGASLLGWISDRIHDRKNLMILCAITMFIFTLLITYMSDYDFSKILFVFFFLLGVSTGAQTLAYASVADMNAHHNIAKSSSMLSLLSVGGGAIAQPLFGFLVIFHGVENYQRGMYVMLFSAMVAIFVSLLFKPEKIEIH